METRMTLTRFAKYAWFVLFYNIAVVLWGAFVRATGSGAGCGSHWPLCNGEVVPRPEQVETIIEFTHRLMSGLALLAVVALVIWAFRAYPRRHPVRYGAAASLFFIITESLVGAGLVLFGLVADNESTARALAMSVHLINTFLLLASIALTAWWASGMQPVALQGRNWLVWALRVGLLLVIVVGVSGAVTALGDTLYPASSLGEGLRQDFDPTTSVLIRLRVWHPLISIFVGVYLMLISRLLRSGETSPATSRLGRALETLVIVQLAAGFLNVFLLAPVWMQLVHLLLADLVWLSLVLLSASVRAVPVPHFEVVPQQAQI
jgi:heme A synthase